MLAFASIAFVILATASVAMALRNLIHSALLLVASWAGIAAFYLWAGAEFVAFAQALIYLGAVSMVVLFAVLLTHRTRPGAKIEPESVNRMFWGLVTGGAVFGVLLGAVLATDIRVSSASAPTLSVKQLGTQLMGPHLASVLVVGVILTVALLGAVVLAAVDRRDAD